MSSPCRLPSGPGQISPKFEKEMAGERDGSYDEFARDRKRSKIRDFLHSVSSQMQSQLLSSRVCGSSTPPLSMREMPAQLPTYGDPDRAGNVGSSHNAPSSRGQSAMSASPLDEPSPLGLTLRKTPSLLDLISLKLSQANSADHGAPSLEMMTHGTVKNRAKCLVPTVAAQDKLKASNFPASSLKVGTWERVSRYEGDLVGKCYYAKRKLVWEVLESGLKSKIEIQWSDISALKASCAESLPSTLEIEVSRPPLFFRETNPQPRKHTLWQATSDFTGGQATLCNRHSLQFPEGVLNRHFEKLVQCDPRLKSLVEGTLVMTPTLEFEHVNWLCDGHQYLPTKESVGYQNNSHDGIKDQQPKVCVSHLFGLAPNLADRSELMSDLKPDFTFVKMHSKDSSSPSSVMDDPRGSDESSDTDDVKPHDDQLEHDVDHTCPGSKDIGFQKLPDVKPSCSNLFMTGDALLTDLRTLEEISQALLGEPSYFNEQARFLGLKEHGRLAVHGQARLLADECQLSNPMIPHTALGISTSSAENIHSGPRLCQVKSEMEHKDNALDSIVNGSPMMHASPSQKDLSFNSVMSCFGKIGSAGDLLLNLPRVASLPQLFESTSQAPSVRYDPTLSRSAYFGGRRM